MKNSGIQWTDHTFNPWIGCTKVSEGCKLCYAEHSTFARVKRSQGHETWGKGAQRQRTSADYWKQPLKWEQEAALHGFRPRVFCASLADWLDAEVPITWLADLLKLIHATPHLDWLLLTKRPENWKQRMIDAVGHITVDYWVYEWLGGKAPANVWFGTTVENQQRADERIPILLTIPARIRFLSCEPLLEALDLTEWLAPMLPASVAHHQRTNHPGGGAGDEYDCDVCDFHRDADSPRIHWAIIGGESGDKTDAVRPCDIGWIRWLVSQCQRAGVPAFVKQLGSKPEAWEAIDRISENSGPHINLRHKKGGEITEWPEDLRIRQFPTITRA